MRWASSTPGDGDYFTRSSGITPIILVSSADGAILPFGTC